MRLMSLLVPGSIFWQNGTGGLLNQVDFFENIAKHISVYCGDIDCLEKGLVRLKNGETIASDAIISGPGWVPSLQFFSEEQCRELGLPHLRLEEISKEYTYWAQLESEAGKKVLSTFLQLADPPPHYQRPDISTPSASTNKWLPYLPTTAP